MTAKTQALPSVTSLPFFADAHPIEVAFLERHMALAHYRAGATICSEGSKADVFHIVRHGIVAMELYVPARGAFVSETLQDDEVLGWSWMSAPYRWTATARATGPTETVCFDAIALRQAMRDDTVFGYRMAMRFLPIASRRLSASRMQVLDFYRTANSRKGDRGTGKR